MAPMDQVTFRTRVADLPVDFPLQRRYPRRPPESVRHAVRNLRKESRVLATTYLAAIEGTPTGFSHRGIPLQRASKSPDLASKENSSKETSASHVLVRARHSPATCRAQRRLQCHACNGAVVILSAQRERLNAPGEQRLRAASLRHPGGVRRYSLYTSPATPCSSGCIFLMARNFIYACALQAASCT